MKLRLTEHIQAFKKIQRQINEAKTIKSGKSHRSESVVSSRSALSLRFEPARLRAEMEFLEHEKELRRLKLLKEVSIADAEEKAFKRVTEEGQTYMRPG